MTLTMTVDNPTQADGEPYVPLKEVVEGFGGEERWDGGSMTAWPLLCGKEERVTIGFTHGAYISEKGSIMVPLDYFRRVHGIQSVSFDRESGKIELVAATSAGTGGRKTIELHIELNKEDAILGIGETLHLQARVLPSSAANPVVVWGSSNPNIASVDQNGLVRAVSAGTVTIAVTASYRGGYTIKAARITVQSHSQEPRALVTTFSGCPQTERAFTWYTSPDAVETIVEYAPYECFETGERKRAYGDRTLFNTKCTCGTDHGLRNIHKVRLKGLIPGTVYTYRAGDGTVWSETGQFTTEDEKADSFAFLYLTDPQGSAEDHYRLYGNTLRAGLETFPDSRFILMGGDAVEEGNREDWWDFYFDYAQPFIGNLPLMSLIGNHETRGGGILNFSHHFYYPDNGHGLAAGLCCGVNNPEFILAMDNTIYSFDYGDAHFSCLNTGSSRDGKDNPEGFLEVQRDWLRKDMMQSDKKWKIIALHRAVYGSNDDKTDVRAVFGTLFDELAIDLVLQGHDHVYVRSYPMKNNVPQKAEGAAGPVYLTVGASGRKLYALHQQPWIKVGNMLTEPVFSGIRINKQNITVAVYSLTGMCLDTFVIS